VLLNDKKKFIENKLTREYVKERGLMTPKKSDSEKLRYSLRSLYTEQKLEFKSSIESESLHYNSMSRRLNNEEEKVIICSEYLNLICCLGSKLKSEKPHLDRQPLRSRQKLRKLFTFFKQHKVSIQNSFVSDFGCF
jgi:hypothetical protein